MLIRIVRMHFTPEGVEKFLEIFKTHEHAIGNFPGCRQVQLLKDAGDDLCYCTLSHWDGAEHLEDYRNSALFASVWRSVKPLFSEKTIAFSLVET